MTKRGFWAKEAQMRNLNLKSSIAEESSRIQEGKKLQEMCASNSSS